MSKIRVQNFPNSQKERPKGERKNNKNFAKKSFRVFRGLPWAPANTLKLFFDKMIYYFFQSYEKYIFYQLKIFFTKKC